MNGDPKKRPEVVEKDKTEGVGEPGDNSAATALILENEHEPPTVVADHVTELEELLAEAKDQNKEIIFYFILVLTIILTYSRSRIWAIHLRSLSWRFLSACCCLELPGAWVWKLPPFFLHLL